MTLENVQDSATDSNTTSQENTVSLLQTKRSPPRGPSDTVQTTGGSACRGYRIFLQFIYRLQRCCAMHIEAVHTGPSETLRFSSPRNRPSTTEPLTASDNTTAAPPSVSPSLLRGTASHSIFLPDSCPPYAVLGFIYLAPSRALDPFPPTALLTMFQFSLSCCIMQTMHPSMDACP